MGVRGDRRVPFVSVVMAVRDEADHIEESLGAVLAQRYPSDRFEIIVADGMSSDGTREIVRRVAAARPDVAVLVIENQQGIVSTGLNAAIQLARGDVIVRVDGHTQVAVDYVAECVETLRRTAADNVGGPMRAVGRTRFGQAVAVATSTPFGVGGARFHYSNREEPVDTVYLGAWPRDVIDRIGGFDEEMVRNQDDELNYRLLDAGGRIWLNPRIHSTYHTRSTARALLRQYFGYGFWKVLVLRKHPRQARLRHAAPPVFALTLALTAAAAPFVVLDRVLFETELGLYLVGNVGATLWTVRRFGVRHLPFLPPVFAILHLGYGFGFLAGSVRFYKRLLGLEPPQATQ